MKGPIGYLYNLFNIKFSTCVNCSYDINKNIKKDIKYKTCVTHIIHSINMPSILSFIFELKELI